MSNKVLSENHLMESPEKSQEKEHDAFLVARLYKPLFGLFGINKNLLTNTKVIWKILVCLPVRLSNLLLKMPTDAT